MHQNDVTIIDDLRAGLRDCLVSQKDLLLDVVVDNSQKWLLGLQRKRQPLDGSIKWMTKDISTSDSGSSGEILEILNLRWVIALPILTDKGRHFVKKLQALTDKYILIHLSNKACSLDVRFDGCIQVKSEFFMRRCGVILNHLQYRQQPIVVSCKKGVC